MSSSCQHLGRWGEDVATLRLQATGYSVIERNYRCPAGEMDIVAQQGNQWVFVEVKTRRGDNYGRPEDAITPAKAQRLLRVAESYLQEHKLGDVDWRVDVIAVELDRSGRLLRIDQVENAVTGW